VKRQRPATTTALLVEDARWLDRLGSDVESEISVWIAAAADRADAEIAPGSEVSVVLSNDDAIRDLNRSHRGIDKPTNVLSFPQDDPDSDRYGPLLGDIVVAFETVDREAVDGGLPLRHHLTHMIVHGFLHLVGYDHQDDDEAEEMERLETAILAALDNPDPYADPPAGGGGH
jgi:probable rRNA maturation factor